MIVKTQTGRGEKIHVMVDGAYTATTTRTFWFSLGVSEGSDLTEEELTELLEKISHQRLYEKALDLLSARDYSRKELSDKLIRKTLEKQRLDAKQDDNRDFGLTEASFSTVELSSQKKDMDALRQETSEICDKLEELGLLNDERYARTYLQELIRNKHLSERGLQAELMKKGVPRSIISNVLEETELDPMEPLSQLLNGKYRSRDLTDERQKQRTVNALLRLGYRYGEVMEAIDRHVRMAAEYDC